MVRPDHPKLSICQQCKLVSLSRSAFCYTPAGIGAATLDMMKEIGRVFTKYPFFGSAHRNVGADTNCSAKAHDFLHRVPVEIS